MTPSLIAQIEVIQNRINSIAPTATAEDVVMLSKAIEAIGTRATIIDVLEAGQQQIDAVESAFITEKDAALSAIDSSKTTALTALTQSKDACLAEINPQNFSLAAVQAAILCI